MRTYLGRKMDTSVAPGDYVFHLELLNMISSSSEGSDSQNFIFGVEAECGIEVSIGIETSLLSITVDTLVKRVGRSCLYL